MQLIWVDPHYGSILLVEIADFPHILAAENHIIVKLIPERGDAELWAREVRDGAEVDAADAKDYGVRCSYEDG